MERYALAAAGVLVAGGDAGASLPAKVSIFRTPGPKARRVGGASQCIAYNLSALKTQRCRFCFAALRKQVGIFAARTADAALTALTVPLRGPKGNLTFPHDQALRLDLIGRVAAALAAQYEQPD